MMDLYNFEDIYNIATALVKHVLCPHLRDDLRQEFCMGALLGMQKVSQEKGARGYVWIHGWGQMTKFWKNYDREHNKTSLSTNILVPDMDGGYEPMSEGLTNDTDKTPLELAELSELSDITEELLRHTSKKRKYILYYRYLRREPMTYTQIGKRMGFSKQYAAQEEKKALDDIRKWMVWNLKQLKKEFESPDEYSDVTYIENEDLWQRIDGMWEHISNGE